MHSSHRGNKIQDSETLSRRKSWKKKEEIVERFLCDDLCLILEWALTSGMSHCWHLEEWLVYAFFSVQLVGSGGILAEGSWL